MITAIESTARAYSAGVMCGLTDRRVPPIRANSSSNLPTFVAAQGNREGRHALAPVRYWAHAIVIRE